MPAPARVGRKPEWFAPRRRAYHVGEGEPDLERFERIRLPRGTGVVARRIVVHLGIDRLAVLPGAWVDRGPVTHQQRPVGEPEVRRRTHTIRAHRVEELAGMLIATERCKGVRSRVRDICRLNDDLFLALVREPIDELRLRDL